MPTLDFANGTNIGDMTVAGGLAAAFDVDTTQTSAQSALAGGQNGWIGKSTDRPTAFTGAVIYGSTDDGFDSSGNNTITINIRGKVGATPPTDRTDGTIIGTTSFTDTNDESAGRAISSTDLTTKWHHIFADISRSAGGGSTVCSELQLGRFFADGMMAAF